MATPIQLRVDVDMAELLKAARSAGKSLDDVIDDFEDLEDSSASSTRAVTSDLDDVGDSAKQAGKAVDRAGGDLEDMGGSADQAGGALQGLGQTAKAALEGDLSGAVDGASDVLAGFAESIPGVAGVVGGALVAAVAAWITELDLFGQKANEVKDEVAGALVEAGGAFDAAALESRVRDIVNSTDDWAAAQTVAAATGRELGDVIGAMAEGGDRLTQINQEFGDATEDAYNGVGNAAQISGKKLKEAQDIMNGTAEGFSTGATKADAAKKAIGTLGTTAKTSTDSVSKLSSTIGGIPAVKDTTVRVRVDSSAWDRWRPQQKVATVGGIPSQSPTYGSRQYP